MKGRISLTAIIILLFCLNTSGQDISVTADYPRVVSAGQQFSISYTINSGGGKFSEPSFNGFYKLIGPQTSYSSSTQIINGKISQETSYSYVYYLQAVKEGRFVIEPAKITIKNKVYSSDSLVIEVTAGNVPAQSAQGSGRNQQVQEDIQEGGDNIFVTLTPDKKEVYQGEHLAVTVKLFTRVDISGINEIKYPEFNGFLKTDLETPQLTSLRRETINGTVYGTGVVQQFLLYPQITGEITVDPVQISVLIRQKSGQSDPFFGDFFTNYTTVPKMAVSKPLKIKVLPLPGVKPDDFSGIVGKASITASINKDTVNVNDAVNLKVVISGSGNLKLANAPDIKMPADIEVYDPKVTDDLKSGQGGTSGRKTFEYLLIPRHYGEFVIPQASYSYFNVSTKQYERMTIPEIRFYAKRGTEENTGGVAVYGSVRKEDVKYLGKDIRFVSSKPGNLRKSANLMLNRRYFYTIYLFALFLFLVVLFIRREHIRRNADISAVKNRKAAKVAGKRLKEAERCLKEKQTDKFFEEILKALWGYLSDKLGIPVSELTRNSAIDSLKEKGITDEAINTLSSILDMCEYARYAPASSVSEAERIYDQTAGFIRLVENSIS